MQSELAAKDFKIAQLEEQHQNEKAEWLKQRQDLAAKLTARSATSYRPRMQFH